MDEYLISELDLVKTATYEMERGTEIRHLLNKSYGNNCLEWLGPIEYNMEVGILLN